MRTSWGGGGGGGSGFGGFPYRGSHEQGNDGTGRSSRRNYRGRRKNPATMCTAELFVPADRRGLVIGTGGRTVKKINHITGATVEIPLNRRNMQHHGGRGRGRRTDEEDPRGAQNQQDRRPIRVKADHLSSLFFACWEVAHILAPHQQNEDNNDEFSISCRIYVPANAPPLRGCLVCHTDGQFQVSLDGDTSVFGLETFLDQDAVANLVDNIHFANSELTAKCIAVPQNSEDRPPTIIFVHGSQEQKPQQMCEALKRATVELWTKTCAASVLSQPIDDLPPDAFTVGTWNLLHPTYAAKYHEKPGVERSGESNWNFRCPAIARVLLESNLDIYLLQEVDAHQMQCELFDCPNQSLALGHRYECIHFPHPTRENDGVAVILKKRRFALERSEMVPFDSKLEEHSGLHYMCAATAVVQDSFTGLRLLLASVHFYERKSLQPQQRLLEYLRSHDCDAVVWGGDCNSEYKERNPGLDGEYSCVREGHRCTRGEKRIDWIFFTPALTSWRSKVSESFVDATMKKLEATGFSPSDHFGEAITLTQKKHDEIRKG